MTQKDEELDNMLYSIKIGCRVTEDDFKILEEGINKLKHYRDTSVGLFCIDKNPKDVTKEWIDKNSFQLKY